MEKKAFTIAITGKGGVGKTTLTSLIIHYLSKRSNSILAIDADPNLNLNDLLGVDLEETVGSIRESMKTADLKEMSKPDFVSYKIDTSLTETNKFDLIAMGRPEGPGCYCYANNIVKETILKLINSYRYIVLDNEAGLENLSRRIIQDIDLLIVVTNPSLTGIKTAGRIKTICSDLQINVKQMGIIVNQLFSPDLLPNLQDVIIEYGLNVFGLLHEDKNIRQLSESGNPLTEMVASDCIAYQELKIILDNLLIE